MNIHIVCRDIGEDKVLPRLAATLAAGTGWSLSDQPDRQADLNYFMIYIDWAERFSDWHFTPIAAYFSHYEPELPYKRFWWDSAAAAMDLCIITAEQYRAHLPPNKPIVKVTPPIDPQFKIEGKAKNLTERPCIGFSGYVDPRSTRKGQALVARLASDLGEQYDFIASGHGWPVETRLVPFADLPAFYRSLDVLVCTSLLEGIPLPPLEALACGVPVVIPQHVGLLDELPDATGIARYVPGDYQNLKATVETAAHTASDPLTLADRVMAFTPAQFCADHRAALEQTRPIVVNAESDRHGSRGVVYVAYGTPARACAENAIKSFKHFMPGVPVALVADRPLGVEDVFIQHADEDIGGRSPKTLIDTLAPAEWQYVMYLDADTEIVAPIDFLFQVLEDGFDFVICKNPQRFHIARYMVRSDNKDECEETFSLIGTDEVMQLNGGVFTYQRNSRTRAFFETWHAEWARYGKRDQAALLRALWAHPLKMYVLTNVWNTIVRYDPANITAGILHYPMQARRWRGVLHSRSDSPEAWQAVKQFEAQA